MRLAGRADYRHDRAVTWPSSAAAWRLLIEQCASLTDREREAMIIHYADWPEGVSNLRYMTQRQMAAKMGVSKITFLNYLDRGMVKLGLRTARARRKIPRTLRRQLLAQVDETSVCDLCQRGLGLQVALPSTLVWSDLLGPPRFAEKLSVDHIVPIAQGGSTVLTNLRLVHAICNLRDGPRRAVADYDPPPFGYVRLSEVLANGRGPRTWIEVADGEARIVRFVINEYATRGHSLRSLARALRAQRRQFDSHLVAPLLRGHIDAQGHRLLELLSDRRYRGLSNQAPVGDQPRRSSPFPALVPEQVALAVQARLELRWQRRQRAAETRATRGARRSKTAALR
jgi:5-methylcytosine-specific restriction endonuclease McrA